MCHDIDKMSHPYSCRISDQTGVDIIYDQDRILNLPMMMVSGGEMLHNLVVKAMNGAFFEGSRTASQFGNNENKNERFLNH